MRARAIVTAVLLLSVAGCGAHPDLYVSPLPRPPVVGQAAETDNEYFGRVVAEAEKLQRSYADGYKKTGDQLDKSQLPIIAAAAAGALLILLKAKYLGDLVGGIGIGAAAYVAGRDQVLPRDSPALYLNGYAATGCLLNEAPLFQDAARKTAFDTAQGSVQEIAGDLEAMLEREPVFSVVAVTRDAEQRLYDSAMASAELALEAATSADTEAQAEQRAYDRRSGIFSNTLTAIATRIATRGRIRPEVDFSKLKDSFYTPPTPKAGDGVQTNLSRQPDVVANDINQTVRLLRSATRSLKAGTPDYSSSLTAAAMCVEKAG